MSLPMISGLLSALALIVGASVVSGLKRKKEDKERGNNAGIVAGVIMGTLVGGSSTIGTAQLAYRYGMSAWWFTLGGGIACLVQTLFYCKPLRASGIRTLTGMIREEYGEAAGLSSSVLSSLGTFINILSQMLAASAVVLVIFPAMPGGLTILLSALVMICYVIFGGTRGAGLAGIFKLVLMYLCMMLCGFLALRFAGGATAFPDMVRAFQNETGTHYFSLLARGAGTDIGSCLSLVLGVLTTQTYAQGYLTAKSDSAARAGGLCSAFLMPPIGILGILVGLYMRSVTDPATFDAKTALTKFIMDYLPGFPAGLALGTLFLASVGTGAGLALGIATVIQNDVLKRVTIRREEATASQWIQRGLIFIILLLAAVLSMGPLGDTILNFAFMSMGLRGAVIFLPLSCALFAKGRIRPAHALAAMIAGPLPVLLFNTVLQGVLPFDPLFAGIFVSALIMCTGIRKKA